MSLNILTFVLFYLIIINSTIGIGYLIGHFFTKIKKEYNLGYYGLTGIFVLIIFLTLHIIFYLIIIFTILQF